MSHLLQQQKWVRTASKLITPQYKLIIIGYVRSAEKLSLCFKSHVPYAIIIIILMYTYYYEGVISQLNNFIKLTNTSNSISIISKQCTLNNELSKGIQLLAHQNHWDPKFIQILCNHEVIHRLLDVALLASNCQLIKQILWLLINLEAHETSDKSVLIEFKPQNKLLQLVQQCHYVHDILSHIFNLFANMAGGKHDLESKKILIQEGILDALLVQIQRLISMDFSLFNYSICELIETITLTLRNLATKETPKRENWQQFVTIAILAFKTIINFKKYIYQNPHEYYCISDLLQFIHSSLINLSHSFLHITKYEDELMDLLMVRLVATETLTDLIKLLSFSPSMSVRSNITNLFIWISADDYSIHVRRLINYGIVDEIINIFKLDSCNLLTFTMKKTQRSGLLLIISNLLATNFQICHLILSKDESLDIIVNHLKQYNRNICKIYSLLCINNILFHAALDEEMVMKILHKENGYVIKHICCKLNKSNNLENGKQICDVMECIHHIVKSMKIFCNVKSLAYSLFQRENIIEIFKKIKFIQIKNNDHNISILPTSFLFKHINDSYLRKLKLDEFYDAIEYLIFNWPLT